MAWHYKKRQTSTIIVHVLQHRLMLGGNLWQTAVPSRGSQRHCLTVNTTHRNQLLTGIRDTSRFGKSRVHRGMWELQVLVQSKIKPLMNCTSTLYSSPIFLMDHFLSPITRIGSNSSFLILWPILFLYTDHFQVSFKYFIFSVQLLD